MWRPSAEKTDLINRQTIRPCELLAQEDPVAPRPLYSKQVAAELSVCHYNRLFVLLPCFCYCTACSESPK